MGGLQGRGCLYRLRYLYQGVSPAGCIHLERQKAIHTPTGCQACMACIHVCPEGALVLDLPMREPNPAARYRNEHVSLAELIAANEQVDQGASAP